MKQNNYNTCDHCGVPQKLLYVVSVAPDFGDEGHEQAWCHDCLLKAEKEENNG